MKLSLPATEKESELEILTDFLLQRKLDFRLSN